MSTAYPKAHISPPPALEPRASELAPTTDGALEPQPASASAREAPSRVLHRWRAAVPRVNRGTIGLTIVTIVLGVYLAAQWQSKPRRAAAPEYRREVATATIHRLEAEQADLKRQIAELRAQIGERRQSAALVESTMADLTAGLEAEKLLAGTVPVRGAGLRVVLDDSSVKNIPPKDDPSMYIIHEYQLRDVVNVLWASGAEAISVNGERIVGLTSIYCVGSTILVNDTRTSPPYEFLVVGDPGRLEAALGDAANLKALKSRIKIYGLQFTVQKPREVTLPAFTGGLNVRHAVLPSGERADLVRTGAR